jgi:threonylcarbamoyladenosine tRNA methylthiotransferase MtaB
MNDRSQSVEALSFGCRLNLLESDMMRRAALAQGRENLVIVNSCAVTAEAERQTRQAIRRIKRERPSAEIVVTGCASQINPARFLAMPEVSALVGNREKTDPEVWNRTRGRIITPDITRGKTAPPAPASGIEGHTRAFLAVQTGCDHRCSFCIIPLGRGPSCSVPFAEALRAACRLVGQGYREIVLTGVDLTSYGLDLDGEPGLGRLVKAILAAAPGLDRLRLSSIDCIEADAALVAAFADEPRLMPHLHLSLQAGDDLILKRMKRRHSRTDAIRFCEKLRRLRPDITFGADLIAGFPTETEAMFRNTLGLLEDCGLTFLHVFPFSARPGTPAERMPKVAAGQIKERAARLRDRGALLLRAHLDKQVGKILRVLTERGGIGHAEDFTPVRTGAHPPARLIDAAIVASDGKSLES